MRLVQVSGPGADAVVFYLSSAQTYTSQLWFVRTLDIRKHL